jgi:hypothetical protein
MTQSALAQSTSQLLSTLTLPTNLLKWFASKETLVLIQTLHQAALLKRHLQALLPVEINNNDTSKLPS